MQLIRSSFHQIFEIGLRLTIILLEDGCDGGYTNVTNTLKLKFKLATERKRKGKISYKEFDQRIY